MLVFGNTYTVIGYADKGPLISGTTDGGLGFSNAIDRNFGGLFATDPLAPIPTVLAGSHLNVQITVHNNTGWDITLSSALSGRTGGSGTGWIRTHADGWGGDDGLLIAPGASVPAQAALRHLVLEEDPSGTGGFPRSTPSSGVNTVTFVMGTTGTPTDPFAPGATLAVSVAYGWEWRGSDWIDAHPGESAGPAYAVGTAPSGDWFIEDNSSSSSSSVEVEIPPDILSSSSSISFLSASSSSSSPSSQSDPSSSSQSSTAITDCLSCLQHPGSRSPAPPGDATNSSLPAVAPGTVIVALP